jgi:hypothetical protein
MSSTLIFELENVRSKSRKLEERNEKLTLLLHRILDKCHSGKKIRPLAVESMFLEEGVKIREDFNWDYRKEGVE